MPTNIVWLNNKSLSSQQCLRFPGTCVEREPDGGLTVYETKDGAKVAVCALVAPGGWLAVTGDDEQPKG